VNLSIVSSLLFFTVKMVYGQWGDYASHYWAVVYYSALYFMLSSLLNYIRQLSFSVLQRWYFCMASAYFAILMVFHLAFLINIEWYTLLISDVGKITTGGILLLIGLLLINCLRIKTKPWFRKLKKDF
jgi:hypothetical protein